MRSFEARLHLYSLALGPALVVVAALLLQPWFDPRLAFMDPIIAGQTADCCHLYYGAASNLGALYMASAAVACLFAAAALGPVAERGGFRFLLTAGLVSGWLCLDDLFLLHEGVAPKLGVPQTAALAFDAALIAAYLFLNRQRLLAGQAPLLLLALVGLGLSTGIDVVLHSPSVVAVEDAAKLLGLAAWAGFHWSIALESLAGLRQSPARR